MKLTDARGRGLKVGARVRGNFKKSGIEVHGIVTKVYHTEKHGWVLEIEEFNGNRQNLPAFQCRRMYGNTKATKAEKTAAKKKVDRRKKK